jgi:hypothetical protein
MSIVPNFCTLEGITEISAGLSGVTLTALGACDIIHAQTSNSDYEIFLLDPATGRAVVRGGKHLVAPTEATVNGSTLGGCMIKMGWLGVGLRMEIYVGKRCLITTPVESLRVEVRSTPEHASSERLMAVC